MTNHLLSINTTAYKSATHSPFLLAAGQGTLPKATLGKWLANDRLYIHAYIKAVGRVLSVLDLPQITTDKESAETKFADWLIATLTALRREERLFSHVAKQYGLTIDLESTSMNEGGRDVQRVPGTAKVPGLVMLERLFGSVHPASTVDRDLPIPWLEAAVLFYGTEKVYSDAWSWAKSKQAEAGGKAGKDADGGALRDEFIPNWSNDEFAAFVEQLAGIIDDTVHETLKVQGGVKNSLIERTEKVWRELVAAETAFWPDLE